ncbi:hypothetical protein D3C73_890940 [compost metagenome]
MNQELRHQIIGDRYRAADSQLIRDQPFRLNLMFARLIDLKNLLGIGQELPAFIREINLLPHPVEDSAIQLAFKRLYAGSNCRLGNIQNIRCLIEAPVVVDIDERFDIFNVQ